MALFKTDLWKQITVDLEGKSFSMKINDRQKLFTVSGKINLNIPYAANMTLENDILQYKPDSTRFTFQQIAEQFERMLVKDK